MTTPMHTRAEPVPPREDWPEPPTRTRAGDLLTDRIVATLRLNGLLMDTAQQLADAGGLTAAWWQVLGGILDEPRTVADIGRKMGITRQGVQRVADLLVERGLAEYRPTPHIAAQSCWPAPKRGTGRPDRSHSSTPLG